MNKRKTFKIHSVILCMILLAALFTGCQVKKAPANNDNHTITHSKTN